MPVSGDKAKSVEYRYFAYDLLTNELLAEIPFIEVSYGRALKESGTFEGSIAVTEDTFNLSLYETTLPARTALYIVRNKVCVWGGIIWSRSYDIVSKSLSVSASEFTSYLYNRVVWKTWSNQYQGSIAVTGGNTSQATVTLDFAQFDFQVGQPINIDWGDGRRAYNGYYTVKTVGLTEDGRSTFTVNANYVNAKGATRNIPEQIIEGLATIEVRQDTYDYARDLLTELTTDLADFDFANDAIEPGIDIFNEITSYSRSGNVATLNLEQSHELVPGQKINIVDAPDGLTTEADQYVIETPSNFSFTVSSKGANKASTVVAGSEVEVDFWQRLGNIITITTSTQHNFPVGSLVFLENVNTGIDAFHIIFSTGSPTANNFQFVSAGVDTGFNPASSDAIASITPAATYSTYGEFTENGDIGIEYSTTQPSGKSKRNDIIRGFELKTVGEILEEYSNVPGGFEYRIDCEYNESTGKFKRIFKFLPLVPSSLTTYIDSLPDKKLPTGEFAPVSAFGADKNIFEYPGNVSNASLEETAEDSATRFWIQGDDPNLSTDASQPYSAASDVDFLFRGWPILDQVEKISNFSDEGILYDYAKRFLAESRPPISNFSVQVNGSLKPEIGSYGPGDWCSVIINDDFVRLRLESYLENRDGIKRDVLLRKIDAFTVTVPDNPAFPEEVELELVIEPEVDKVGN
jgi:hypothetical protein